MPCSHCAGWWWWCNGVGDVFLHIIDHSSETSEKCKYANVKYTAYIAYLKIFVSVILLNY